VEYIAQNHSELENRVYAVPDNIDREVARLKLKVTGVHIDILTDEQEEYLASWQVGT
jgi:adenosylhomocysteinase